jgi:anaerobic magnesium-protoporphyrin IX monomethyl ester cyclase
VRFVDLADENPTTAKQLWRTFLEALIAQDVPVRLVATIRADDAVRDADILHLYKKAGFSRILLGVETTDSDTIARIRKDAATEIDREAIRLLRRHDILSQLAYLVGFEGQTDRDFLIGLRQLVSYDPDQINAMYVTPHRWTPFYRESAGRRIVEEDRSRWDYRHQVLAAGVPAWRVFLWVKLTEAVVQLRPRAGDCAPRSGDPQGAALVLRRRAARVVVRSPFVPLAPAAACARDPGGVLGRAPGLQ